MVKPKHIVIVGLILVVAIVAYFIFSQSEAEKIKQQAHKAAKVKEDAEALAEKLNNIKLELGAKAGEKGKIFGIK